jgi:hypothetical protein
MAAETPETVPETLPDHYDEMLHRIVAFCDRWEPVLEKAEKFMHNPVGAYLKSPMRPKAPVKP